MSIFTSALDRRLNIPKLMELCQYVMWTQGVLLAWVFIAMIGVYFKAGSEVSISYSLWDIIHENDVDSSDSTKTTTTTKTETKTGNSTDVIQKVYYPFYGNNFSLLKAAKGLVSVALTLSVLAFVLSVHNVLSGKPRTPRQGKSKIKMFLPIAILDAATSGALLSSLVCWIEFADEGKGSGFAFSILSMLLGVGAAVLAMVGKKCTFMDESVGGVRVKSFALPVGVG